MSEKLQKYIENKKYDLALQLINKLQKKQYSLEYHNYKIVVYLLAQKYDAALIDLNELIQKYPNDPSILCNMGLAYKGKKKFNDAINFLNKSLQIDSVNLNTKLNLIETYIEIFNYKSAIELLKSILQNNLRIERCYQLLAFCYREINEFKESHYNLECAININPYNYENFYHIGFSFIWKKDFCNAITSFKKCIELNKNYIPAVYQLNKLINVKLNSDEFNQINAINDDDLDTFNLGYKHLTLSEVYYNHNDYGHFFIHLHKANQLKNSLINFKPYEHIKIKDQYNNLVKFNFENLEITPVFIIGMPRSGSSLIEQVLSESEDIYAAGEIPLLHENFKTIFEKKEIVINYEVLNFIKNHYIDYITLFPKKKFFIDKLPLNFLWLGFIKIIFPNAIFIHSIRNKLDVCMSLYRTFFADGILEFSYNQKNISNFYSIYEDMISFWKSENINLIDLQYEDLINDPKFNFGILFDKLNLKFNKAFLDLENIDRPVKTASFLQINNKIKKIKYPDWTNYKKDIELFLNN